MAHRSRGQLLDPVPLYGGALLLEEPGEEPGEAVELLGAGGALLGTELRQQRLKVGVQADRGVPLERLLEFVALLVARHLQTVRLFARYEGGKSVSALSRLRCDLLRWR